MSVADTVEIERLRKALGAAQGALMQAMRDLDNRGLYEAGDKAEKAAKKVERILNIRSVR